MRNRARYKQPEQGFILIAVLGMIMLLSLIAAFIAGYAEQRLEQTLELRTRWQQQLNRQAQLATLQFELATGGQVSGGWQRLENNKPASPLLRGDGRRYTGLGGQVFALQDEASLLSLMDPDADRWQRLLMSRGLSFNEAEQFIDQLRDYTDQDDFRRLNGANKQDYLNRGLEPPPQRFMISPGQVFNLLNAGQWQSLLYRLLPMVTTRSGQLHNLNTMPAPLLATMPGTDQQLAASLVQQRQATPFVDLADANQRLGKLLALDGMSMPSVPSNFIRIQWWPSATECRWSAWTGITLTPQSTRAPWEIDYVFDYHHPQSCTEPVASSATALEP